MDQDWYSDLSGSTEQPLSNDSYGDDYEYLGSCDTPQVAGARLLRATLYIIVLILGVPGNLFLLAALCHRADGASSQRVRMETGRGSGRRGTRDMPGPRRRPWRTSEILTLNLAVSDLLFLGSLPLWIDSELREGAWRGGHVGCKLAPYLTALTMYVGVLLVTIMSVDRYLAVVIPNLYRRLKKQTITAASCTLTWLCSAFLALPVLSSRALLRSTSQDSATYCMEGEEGGSGQLSPRLSLCLLVLTFFLPLMVILFCYSSLLQTLRHHASGPAPGSASLRRSMRVVFCVVAAFLLSWFPFNTFKLIGTAGRLLWPSSCSLQRTALVGMEWSAPLAFANSCMNPFLLGVARRWLLCRGLGSLCSGFWREGRLRNLGGHLGLSSQSSWEGRGAELGGERS